ncbi:MAG: LytTR family DNA-binding domain-containing protein [Acidobacteriota bacterium]
MSQALLRDASQPIRAIVVDDEPPARQWLGSLLQNEESVEVVEEFGDAFAALDAIQRHRPDLVLLDVEMPGMSGFDLVQMMGKGVSPAIVFVTAFDQYAVRAFDVRAIDYLLKPVDPERLKEAVRRAVGQLRQDPPPPSVEPRPAAPSGRRFPEWLLVKSDGRSRFVRVRDIDWIESQKNDVLLHVGAAESLYHLSTSGIEAKLDPSRFLRIHRSTIVSVDRIKDLYPLFNGDYGVTLKDGTTLTMSSTYRRRLAAFRDGML